MKNQNSGFTLIELAIAFSIGTLLLSGGMVSYRDFNHRQQVKTAGQLIKNTLRTAQNQAGTGDKPLGLVCTELRGYRVTFTSNSMESHAECSDGDGPSSFVTLPSQVMFNPLPSSVLFKVLADGVDQGQTVNITGFDKTYSLIITPTGEVQDKEFLENGTTPLSTVTPQPLQTPIPTRRGFSFPPIPRIPPPEPPPGEF